MQFISLRPGGAPRYLRNGPAMNSIRITPGYCSQSRELLLAQGGSRQFALGRTLSLLAEQVAVARWQEALYHPRHWIHHHADSPSVCLAILSL